MDKVNQKMKKFNLRGVLTNLRSSVTTSQKQDVAIEESLKSEQFQLSKITCHGFPHKPTCIASDPIQNLLAIGNHNGYVKIIGKPRVESNLRHLSGKPVTQLLFVINEGALITVTGADEVHLWTLKRKKPELVHSLKFQREKITTCHLPFQCKWLYLGTDRGNVQFLNIETFSLSGYVINWNKAIELSRSAHPGCVVHLSDNPVESTKLLIGFETGFVVQWDLKLKAAEFRFSCSENLQSVCWQQDGKQFICSHGDGSITVWSLKLTTKPQCYMMPHAILGEDGKPEACSPIHKVDFRSARKGEPFIIFNGGTIHSTNTPSLTVMRGSEMTVLQMEYPVVQFIVLCATPWNYDFQDPHAIVVLLDNDLVLVDLNSRGYPCFENPYPMDIHESPVTTCSYYSDIPEDLLNSLVSLSNKRNCNGYSDREWPINGGTSNSYNFNCSELILTGHADGSIKFWDATGYTLQMLYKLKTAKVFDASKCLKGDDDEDEKCMFAVQLIRLCVGSRLLCVAGYTHVLLFKFSKIDSAIEYPVLEVSIVYEVCDGTGTPDTDYPVMFHGRAGHLSHQSGSIGTYSTNGKESITSVKVRPGTRKWPAGFQPTLCCLLTWIENDPPPPISSLSINSKFGLLAFGDECGIAVVDIVQKTCLLSMGTPDLYGSLDPYSRAPRSPKLKTVPSTKLSALDHLSQTTLSDECRSPTADQAIKQQSPSTVLFPSLHKTQARNKLNSRTKCSSSKARKTSAYKTTSCPYLNPEDINDDTRQELAIIRSDIICEENLFGADSDEFEICDSWRKEKEELHKKLSAESELNETSDQSMRKSLSYAISVPLSEGAPIRNHGKIKKTQTINQEASKDSGGFTSEEDIDTYFNEYTTQHTPNETNIQLLEKASASSKNSLSSDGKRFKKKSDSTFKGSEKNGMREETRKRMKEGLKMSRSTSMLKRLVRKRNDFVHNKSVSEDLTVDDIPISPLPQVTSLSHDQKGGLLRRHTSKMSGRLSKIWDGIFGDSKRRSIIVDLSDDLPHHINTYTIDKVDSSFCRSHSSSTTSLENVNKESIVQLSFNDVFCRKTDTTTSPCLWLGTSLGTVLVISITLPSDPDSRRREPLIISPSGTIFRLRGSITTISFLDSSGGLVVPASEKWKESREKTSSFRAPKSRMSPTSSIELNLDKQYAVICSERQARVISLPSQTSCYKVKVTETSCVLKAEVIPFKDSACLTCYVANGHIVVFSLPSLKPLFDVDYVSCPDVRVAKTISFSSYASICFMPSPTEILKLTLNADVTEGLKEGMGEFFSICSVPEAPKLGFFKNFFSGSNAVVDREEIFGEGSGKASKGTARYTAGPATIQESANLATSEIGRAKMAALERGEKLGDLEERTERMKMEAEQFSINAHQLKMKYKDKKWYQF